ncbi:MAG: hypothetical protein FJ033_01570 [Chloroflexi bacterium]|nr:hypothetical protein [Chloroflexota bacterium]
MSSTGTTAMARPTPRTLARAPVRAEATIDREALVTMLHEKDRHIQALEAECRDLAGQLIAFQSEILKWVELDHA